MLTTASTDVSADGASPACHCCSPGVRPARLAMCPPAEEPATATKVAVTAVLVGVRARPCDGRLDIDDLARPSVPGLVRYCTDKHTQPNSARCAINSWPCSARLPKTHAPPGRNDEHGGRPRSGHRAARRRATDPVRRRTARTRGTRTAGVDRHCAMAYRYRRSDQGSANASAATMSHRPAVIRSGQCLALRRVGRMRPGPSGISPTT